MNVLLIRGNPRKDGHTQRLTDIFIAGAKGSGAQVTVVDLTQHNLRECTGCYSCWLVHPGTCIHHDDMPHIMKIFCASDIVVFSSPLNAYAVSSSLKIFLDRVLAWTKADFVSTQSGLSCNSLRDPAHWPAKLAYILVGAFRGEENFSGAARSLELFAEGIHTTVAGRIIRPESYLLQFELAKPKTIKIIETAFERAGMELGAHGEISAETAKTAATPLSSDQSHFEKYANIYWEHACKLGQKALDVALVKERVITDMRVLLSEMARSIDPTTTARLKTDISFSFQDTGQHFVLRVDKGTCSLEQSTSAPQVCDLRVSTTTTTWADLFMRRINGREALVSGAIRLEGDKFVFSRLDRYFPPPVM